MIKFTKHRAKDSVFLYMHKSKTGTISVSFSSNSYYAKGVKDSNTRKLRFDKVYLGTQEEYFNDENICGKI